MSLPPSLGSPPAAAPPVPPPISASAAAQAPAPLPAQQLQYVAPGMDAVVLTPRAAELLRQTRPWVAFIGIVFTVIGVLAIAGALLGGVVVAVREEPVQAIYFFAYAVAGLIYLFPGIYLRRYAARLRDTLNLRSSDHLEAAFGAQKSFWRLVGILVALLIGLYVLLILFAVVGLAVPRLMR